ncbi:MAG TPA: EscU/YscU/HrcU family type III secretion system export apparatus switch protein [Feifaniaceae bacterium]|nr:EscU/YscU/HrcU family type III secretion system export apparatus switch protein [Feifaniaceae bacterium]
MSEDRKPDMQAAALKYDMGRDNAPLIVGLGQGYVAKKILETADENRIPIVEDESLLSVLNRFSAGDEIPVELYQVIAQVLVFVGRLDSGTAGRYQLSEIQKGLYK